MLKRGAIAVSSGARFYANVVLRKMAQMALERRENSEALLTA